jgi:hypothetical protein
MIDQSAAIAASYMLPGCNNQEFENGGAIHVHRTSSVEGIA